VDGSESIGTGHIMRCLALAQELQKSNNKVSFLLALCPPALKKRLADQGYDVSILPAAMEPGSEVDARFTCQFAQERGAAHIVVDGYHFLTNYQRLLKEAKFKLLYIDDLSHCDYYCADFVLNQNPSASRSFYTNCGPHTELLLGFEYLLLRSEFLAYEKTNETVDFAPLARNILVTMGGSDIDNVTGIIMEALSLAPAGLSLQVTVVIGAGNSHGPWLQKLAQSLSEGGPHSFKTRVNAEDMPALLGASDLVISAGGTTVWEAAYLARPTAVIITADNQTAGIEHFAALGAIELLGRQQDLTSNFLSESLGRLIKDAKRRQSLATQAAALIDGQGTSRVVQQILAKTI
jgi:UDP-2,4-diacetamido-2,4,6-trideoxy-beta-L-altropyranose hydrolase